MAEWIKWVKGLNTRAETLCMASVLKMPPKVVAASLMDVWAWADSETPDGIVRGATRASIDAIAGKRGFASAMEDVGHSEESPGCWLEVSAKGVRFKNWEEHNSESAKKRAVDAKRQSRHRDKRNGQFGINVTDPSEPERDIIRTERVTRDREEEEKSKTNTKPPPSRAGERHQIAARNAGDAETGGTPFHDETAETVAGALGTPSAADRRRLAAWTAEVESSPPVDVGGTSVALPGLARTAVGIAIEAGATGTMAGLLAYADKVLSRCRRQGVMPGESKPLKPAKFKTVQPDRNYDELLERGERIQGEKAR